jgi:hypothetical protein
MRGKNEVIEKVSEKLLVTGKIVKNKKGIALVVEFVRYDPRKNNLHAF